MGDRQAEQQARFQLVMLEGMERLLQLWGQARQQRPPRINITNHGGAQFSNIWVNKTLSAFIKTRQYYPLILVIVDGHAVLAQPELPQQFQRAGNGHAVNPAPPPIPMRRMAGLNDLNHGEWMQQQPAGPSRPGRQEPGPAYYATGRGGFGLVRGGAQAGRGSGVDIVEANK